MQLLSQGENKFVWLFVRQGHKGEFHKMFSKKWILFVTILALVLIVSVASVSATRHDIQGLVYIDENLNGVWDVGEAGYGGEWLWG